MPVACDVTVLGGELPQAEIDTYVERAIHKYGREPATMEVSVDGDYVDVIYSFEAEPAHDTDRRKNRGTKRPITPRRRNAHVRDREEHKVQK